MVAKPGDVTSSAMHSANVAFNAKVDKTIANMPPPPRWCMNDEPDDYDERKDALRAAGHVLDVDSNALGEEVLLPPEWPGGRSASPPG